VAKVIEKERLGSAKPKAMPFEKQRGKNQGIGFCKLGKKDAGNRSANTQRTRRAGGGGRGQSLSVKKFPSRSRLGGWKRQIEETKHAHSQVSWRVGEEGKVIKNEMGLKLSIAIKTQTTEEKERNLIDAPRKENHLDVRTTVARGKNTEEKSEAEWEMETNGGAHTPTGRMTGKLAQTRQLRWRCAWQGAIERGGQVKRFGCETAL